MRFLSGCLVVVFCTVFAAAMIGGVSASYAQLPGASGEILPAPQCFNIINRAPYTVVGSVSSNTYTTAEGTTARHRGNFHLKEKEMTEFCISGPFYEGRKVELVLRTLLPIFSCYTKIDQDIMIYGRRLPERGTETWAGCHE